MGILLLTFEKTTIKMVLNKGLLLLTLTAMIAVAHCGSRLGRDIDEVPDLGPAKERLARSPPGFKWRIRRDVDEVSDLGEVKDRQARAAPPGFKWRIRRDVDEVSDLGEVKDRQARGAPPGFK